MQKYTCKNDKFYQIRPYHSPVNAHLVYGIICSNNKKNYQITMIQITDHYFKGIDKYAKL